MATTDLSTRTPTDERPKASINYNRGEILRAFQRGDVQALVSAVQDTHRDTDASENAELSLLDLARFSIELRRENVAVIGSHEAFVRRTATGSLSQVIAPVRLSLGDDTLYQIPASFKDERGQWQKRVEEPHKANVSYQGLLRLNAVAGCAVGMPPSVMIDGEERTNPYRQTSEHGDIERIVVAVNVVGPAPLTGNPVIVQYTLDLDPAKDLQHMLSELSKRNNMTDQVFLIDQDSWQEYRESMEGTQKFRWSWLRVFGNVGLAHNLSNIEVRKSYSKYVNLMQNCLKKALTVARRNAMKAHPALAYHSVRVDNYGTAIVRGVGWAAHEGDINRYMVLMERMARGLLPDLEELEIRTVDDTYEPETDAVGDSDLDVIDADPKEHAIENKGDWDPELQEKNELIRSIDEGLDLMDPSEIMKLNYQPENQSIEELRATFTAMNSMLNGGQE